MLCSAIHGLLQTWQGRSGRSPGLESEPQFLVSALPLFGCGTLGHFHHLHPLESRLLMYKMGEIALMQSGLSTFSHPQAHWIVITTLRPKAGINISPSTLRVCEGPMRRPPPIQSLFVFINSLLLLYFKIYFDFLKLLE